MQRLSDVRAILEHDGWMLLNPEKIWDIEDEYIIWTLRSIRTGHVITIEFYVVGDMGERSEDLRDVQTATVREHGIQLHFVKRTSTKWKLYLAEFIKAIRSTEEGKQLPTTAD